MVTKDFAPPPDGDGASLEMQKHERTGLKTAPDGFTILIPQPSDNPEDPLNWDSFTKHAVLGVVIACSFLPDYGSVTGAVTLHLQAMEYGNSPDEVNHSQSGNVFMVGAGGTVAVMLSAYFGRLPVLFWFMVAALATALGEGLAPGFMGFFVPRVMNGFFAGVAQGGGLMFIRDLFFHHEQARKINLWQSCVILSPFMGPLLASFMTIRLSWRWPFHLYSTLTGLALLGVIVWGRETYYDRNRLGIDQAAAHSRWLELVGVDQWRTRRMGTTFVQAILRSVKILMKPVVVLVLVYYLCIFAWLVAINATLPIFLTELYGFGSKEIGFMYFAPVVAAVLAYGIGHWLHDLLAHVHTKRNSGQFNPESRLIIVWLAIPFMVSGLVIVGFALGRNYHYMLVALGWGFYTFGVIVNSASVNMYLLNSYPEASPEVGMWINFARTAGGFIISYFQVQWVAGVGAEVAFGTQAAICLAVFSIIVVLQVFGKRLREVGGELNL
ncbi:major facilitator superfamily domain-containing protein [Aspergillus keveii]|uniref:Major facilitator superfamily domain-containing protein n=1 Tax=Aspergillus keveii TaxID=714993 RepID=A0ABR4FN21_9EURO